MIVNDTEITVPGGRLVFDPDTHQLAFWASEVPNATVPAVVFDQRAFADHGMTGDAERVVCMEHATMMAMMPHLWRIKAAVMLLTSDNPAQAARGLEHLKDISSDMNSHTATLLSKPREN